MALRSVANKLLQPLEWFYPTARALYMWRRRREYDACELGPVLLLQMGKVGSMSVKAGLEALDLSRPIYHTHFLTRARNAETEAHRREFFRTQRHPYLIRTWLNEFARRTYDKGDDGRVWKIVSLTREPIARNISAFFENIVAVPRDTEGEFEISSHYYRIEPTVVTLNDIDKMSKLFFERASHDSPIRFFDREIKGLFGIDVFNEDFPIEKGYKIYKTPRVEMMVLRLEDLARYAGETFREFLDIDDFKTINRNVGAKKAYAPLYDVFRQNVVIGEDYADKLYESRYMRTFYSDEEISAARARWLGDSR